VELQTEYFTYNITISRVQTEIIGDFEQIKVGAEIEVSGQGIAGMDPHLIVADHVTVLGISTQLSRETWVLTTYMDQQPISEHQPSLKFEIEQISGNTGCNQYGGSYQINGDEISFDGIYSTEMACLAPEGLMEQEMTYLELLSSATRFTLADDVLTIFAGTNPVLIYEKQQVIPEVPTNTPVPSTPIPNTVAATLEVVEPTHSPVFEPPTGYKEYRDSVAGVSIYIPENWTVMGVVNGQYAIFQSYPEDKYAGGGVRESGDTKCDLNLRPSAANVDELIQQWDAAPRTSIVSDEEIVLKSGLNGRRFVIDSMGRAVVLVVEINQRIIKLTCFGNFTPVDGIAQTLRGFEAAPLSPVYESLEGFKQYKDTETGIAIDMPGNWIVTGIVPGQRVGLQSYPENKYIGGEVLEPGDTKCELFTRDDVSARNIISQLRSNEAITIITEEEISLITGQTGTRVELNGLGRSMLVVTEINASTVVLTCYGDLSPVEAIAITLREGQ
ncbi:MAG: META domain-containing protein, partial [Anaerolineales bacterium]